MRLCEAQPVNDNTRPVTVDLDGFTAAREYLYRIRQYQLFGDARQRVVVTADDICADPRAMQPLQLAGQKARSLHGGLVAVIEVAGNDQRVDTFL